STTPARRWSRSAPSQNASGSATSSPRSASSSPSSSPELHDRADDPRRKLLLAHPGELALGALARRDRDDLFEDLPTDGPDRPTLEDDATVDVHVLRHVAVHQRVGGALDRGHRLADRRRP